MKSLFQSALGDLGDGYLRIDRCLDELSLGPFSVYPICLYRVENVEESSLPYHCPVSVRYVILELPFFLRSAVSLR